MGARETRDRSKRMNRIIPENVDGVSMRAQWVSSPEILSSFTKEELEEMGLLKDGKLTILGNIANVRIAQMER